MTLRMMPLKEWLETDRRAWEEAVRPRTLRGNGGGAAKWSTKTRRTVVKRYGQWLSWYTEAYGTLAAVEPAARLTDESLGAYVTELQVRYAGKNGGVSTTVHSMVRDLREALRVMYPGADLQYLTEIVSRLSVRAKPTRRKADRVVHSAELVEAGLAQVAAAQAAVEMPQAERDAKYRDGLIVAFLAFRPLRLANLQELSLSQSVRRRPDGYWFSVHDNLKWRDSPPIIFPLPEVLTGAFEGYLRHCREHLRKGNLTDALWLSTRSTPMSEQALYQQIVTVTARYLGRPIYPHMFRDCAATSIALDDPEHALYIARILGHATLRTAEKHYIHGQAARDFRELGQSIERRRKEARRRLATEQAGV